LATVALVFAKAAGARIAVSLGSESGARDCVNTAPISSLIDVNTAVVPPSAGGVATGGDAVLDVGGTQRLAFYRERFETAHPHASCCYRSISPILSGELRGVLLGSRAQFVDLIDFVAAHRLEPVISGVYDGLGIPGDRQFTGGEHFGKQVIHVSK
jgi:hypothetical protein